MTEIHPLLIGKFLPGVHVPIAEEQKMFDEQRGNAAGVGKASR